MNPLRKALKELLSGDEALKKLATGGVHYKQAPKGAKPPYVIFGRMSEVPERAFDGPTLDHEVWMVKGVGEAAKVEDIDRRCRELLDNADLQIEGRRCLDVHRVGVIDFAETVEGERFDHVGHEYKIDSEETENES